MPKIDAVFTADTVEIFRLRTNMSPANLAEFFREMGHEGPRASLPLPDLARDLETLLATNASPHGDWLIMTARILLQAVRSAQESGAGDMRIETRTAA